MILAVILLFLVFISYIGYKCFIIYRVRKRMDWITHVRGWPVLGNALEFGDTTETISDIERLIRNNGKLILLDFVTQPNIFTTDYNFTEFVLSSQTILTKSMDYRYLNNWLGTGLLTSDGTKWKRRRRMTTPAFHFSILQQFVESFESNGKILIDKLKKEIGNDSTDVYPYINLYALDVICQSAMGVSVEAQKYEHSDYVKNVKLMCRIGLIRTTSIIKCNDLLYRFCPEYFWEKKAIKELHDVTYSVIDKRMNKSDGAIRDVVKVWDDDSDVRKKKKLALLDILLASNVDGEPLSREDIREEVDTFMFEGHDTTTSAMSFAVYLLANHPDVQEKVLEEQKSLFGEDKTRSCTYEDLQNMKYLECVIKETLRLYPSVPMYGRCTTEDVYYNGKIISEGTNIVIFNYGIQRDPEHFDDPEMFKPSRFETIDGKKPFCFLPFSAGPRNCIGQKFAMLEMKSTISRILRNFEVLPAIPEHNLILISEAVLKSKNGMRVKFVPRKWN